MTAPLKDPVCGMTVRPDSAFSASHNGQHFCLEFCRRSFLAHPGTYAGETASPNTIGADLSRRIAYFSMEVGLDSSMPTYSGGLGVLAEDTLKSAADLKIPIVAVSLLYSQGYFDQSLDEWGNQRGVPGGHHT